MQRSHSERRVTHILGAFLVCTALLAAQPTSPVASKSWASIKGIVKDAATGKPLADVTVSTFPGNQSQSIQTDQSGGFSFASLPPGRYTVTAKRDGPKITFSSRTISLAAGRDVT